MLVLTQLKGKLKSLSVDNALYTEIITDELPFGLMITDADHNVLLVNRTLKNLFHIPLRASLQKCYNYVKRIAPCEGCPHIELASGAQTAKKLFHQGDRKITAEARRLEDKFLLFFRDTTREIQLIQDIRVQQSNLQEANTLIAEQNAILKSLSRLNIEIARARDLDAVLALLIESLQKFYDAPMAAIVLFNEVGKIEHALFSQDMTADHQRLILLAIGSTTSLEDHLILEMKTQEKRYGAIYLTRPSTHPDRSIMDLFFMQVISYLENLKLSSRLEELAQTDALTGISNRYFFEKKLSEEIAISQRFGQPISLILVDINGLKKANDSIGHQAGDALIMTTALLLRDNISVYDGIFRLGGDEFVILLSNCPGNQLQIMVDMFLEIQQNQYITVDEQELPVRFSLGGACSETTDYQELLKTADAAMYENKHQFYAANQSLQRPNR
jgi:diguanylate cyclase (GGDEF)-like protein